MDKFLCPWGLMTLLAQAVLHGRNLEILYAGLVVAMDAGLQIGLDMVTVTFLLADEYLYRPAVYPVCREGDFVPSFGKTCYIAEVSVLERSKPHRLAIA